MPPWFGLIPSSTLKFVIVSQHYRANTRLVETKELERTAMQISAILYDLFYLNRHVLVLLPELHLSPLLHFAAGPA